MLAEKQKILAESVQAAKDKLETLESVQDQISQQYAAGDIDRGAYLDFQNELVRTREKLKNLQERQMLSALSLRSCDKKNLTSVMVKDTAPACSIAYSFLSVSSSARPQKILCNRRNVTV